MINSLTLIPKTIPCAQFSKMFFDLAFLSQLCPLFSLWPSLSEQSSVFTVLAFKHNLSCYLTSPAKVPDFLISKVHYLLLNHFGEYLLTFYYGKWHLYIHYLMSPLFFLPPSKIVRGWFGVESLLSVNLITLLVWITASHCLPMSLFFLELTVVLFF